MFKFSPDSPVIFDICAPDFPYPLGTPEEINLMFRMVGSGFIFPLSIDVYERFSEYGLASLLEESLQKGRVVSRRDTSVLIERYPSSFLRKTDFTFMLGEPKKSIFGDDLDSVVPVSPRIRIRYRSSPASSFKVPKEEVLYGTLKLAIFYELPIKCDIAYRPDQEFMRQSKDFVFRRSPFEFVSNPTLSEEEFMKRIVSYLSYDLVFLDASGNRAAWWEDLLRRMQREDHFYKEIDRSGVGSKPFKF